MISRPLYSAEPSWSNGTSSLQQRFVETKNKTICQIFRQQRVPKIRKKLHCEQNPLKHSCSEDDQELPKSLGMFAGRFSVWLMSACCLPWQTTLGVSSSSASIVRSSALGVVATNAPYQCYKEGQIVASNFRTRQRDVVNPVQRRQIWRFWGGSPRITC